ncbi:RluA family pseudouridine synthase [uncultured Vagococcus sp.]|uniref:RluA family pseudouridine synthase n=1 Tax=uncultured Vagococcus sp. TaxID=189676 RepID=UPI00258A53A2|nr:RluA family pseudouridine synthase [uncultured Vagococcus sp.]
MKKSNQKTNKISKQNQGQYLVVQEDTTLLPFLLSEMKGKSRNAIKSTLTRGQIFVDNKAITQHNHALTKGQRVLIQDNKMAMSEQALVGIEVIYEDDDLIVIEKESGMLSIAGNPRDFEVTAHNQLMAYVRRHHPKNRIYVVHRLDKDTSGIMLFAKNEKMKAMLQENWKEIVTERMYTALVEGNVKKQSGTITSWLTESKTFKMYSSSFDNGGKQAITHYKKIRGNKNYSLLEVMLETGRKNQIRVHMEEIGHPIVGDKKYGAHGNPLKRVGLHATTLVFKHPVTGKQMKFTSKVPKKFNKLLKEN